MQFFIWNPGDYYFVIEPESKLAEDRGQIMILSLRRRAVCFTSFMPEGDLRYYLYAAGQLRLSLRRRAILLSRFYIPFGRRAI